MWLHSTNNPQAPAYIYLGSRLLHDSLQARGWFVGRVHSLALSRADLRKTPSANVVIKYDPKLTSKKLHGLETRELSARLHGPKSWWVEVEKE